jgi:hypothetical protein
MCHQRLALTYTWVPTLTYAYMTYMTAWQLGSVYQDEEKFVRETTS